MSAAGQGQDVCARRTQELQQSCLAGTRIPYSQPMRLSQLIRAQTYSGAQAILYSLAQLYIRLYMEKTTHYLKMTQHEHFEMDLAQNFDMWECSCLGALYVSIVPIFTKGSCLLFHNVISNGKLFCIEYKVAFSKQNLSQYVAENIYPMKYIEDRFNQKIDF